VFTVSPVVALRNIAMVSKKPAGRTAAGPKWNSNGFGSARDSQARAAATETRRENAAPAARREQ
jgi:hypothetical protein